MPHAPHRCKQKSTLSTSAKSVLAATARLKPKWSTSRNRVLKSRRKQSAFHALSFHGNEKVHADHVTPAMAVAAIVVSITAQKRVAFELSKRKSTLALNASTLGLPNTSGPCDGACDEDCAKADISKKATTKVVNNEVSLPPWLQRNASHAGPSELQTTELQPVKIQTRSPWSSFSH